MGSKFGTINGHTLFECASAMQKAIRRGLVEPAVYFAVELDLSGYGAYCWRRLKIIASEDIGLADLTLPATMAALHASWVEHQSREQDADRLFLVHAVVLLATSPKSRLIDNLVITEYTKHLDHPIEVPEWAYDVHTAEGKRRGRDYEHFFASSAQVDRHAAEDPHPLRTNAWHGLDPYEETAKALRMAGKEPVPKKVRSKAAQQATLAGVLEEEGRTDG